MEEPSKVRLSVSGEGIPKGKGKRCSTEGCDRKSRAKGMCDTCYRRAAYRERTGSTGIEPLDDTIYKVRVMEPQGSQPYYYSKPEMAYAKAAEARKDGLLLFFGEYKIQRRLHV